eukprot:CAMPEP_0170194328 /NCGR_PEP_ID=MMETSP0040_2-20121228/58972_1 /TAXON_ID=641309 /ORGANISM="Lotharella oceanica, Strain CCMP622" /LENGTH=30 /DNA_ID= /DNA_START= /DNA_END= /DNA_ORIENTATION=
MEFLRHAPVPKDAQNEIIKEYEKQRAEANK